MRRHLWRSPFCAILLAVLTCIAAGSASAAEFLDIPEGHWAEESIQRCVDLGIFQGQGGGQFGIGGEMSRATFATVLCRFYGWETEPPETAPFRDVDAEDDWAGAVEALLSHGVVPDQLPEFRPTEPISREEMAVMLVRSMGYGALAGLVQDLPGHFQDVHTSTGYITIAYNLGLTNGTSPTTFSPDRAVTREEVAVTLMRLYDKLHAPVPEVAAIVSEPEEGGAVPDMTGLDVAAIAAGRLMGVGNRPSLANTMSPETAAALRDQAQAAGAKALLHITGGPSALDAPLDETVSFLTNLVSEGGCDGLMLDIPEVPRDQRRTLTALVRGLSEAMEGRGLLYLTVEAPVWYGREYGGYDYSALSAAVDRLVLRVASYEAERTGTFPIAPVNPIEEVYYALTAMKGQVELSRLSLLIDTVPAVWGTDARPRDLSRAELEAVLDSGRRQYSQRYGCAYLDGMDGSGQVAVWYLDGEAIAARRQMLLAFGLDHLCLTSWQDAPLELLTGA